MSTRFNCQQRTRGDQRPFSTNASKITVTTLYVFIHIIIAFVVKKKKEKIHCNPGTSQIRKMEDFHPLLKISSQFLFIYRFAKGILNLVDSAAPTFKKDFFFSILNHLNPRLTFVSLRVEVLAESGIISTLLLGRITDNH